MLPPFSKFIIKHQLYIVIHVRNLTPHESNRSLCSMVVNGGIRNDFIKDITKNRT